MKNDKKQVPPVAVFSEKIQNSEKIRKALNETLCEKFEELKAMVDNVKAKRPANA